LAFKKFEIKELEKNMFKTKNDIPQETRVKIVELLNERLADMLDLQSQTKQAHWNVKGSHFYSLHLLFDSVYENTVENVDTIAERIMQLGGVAEGTIKAVAKRTTLPEYSITISDGEKHIAALSTALAHCGKNIRHSIDMADELKDKDTADIFTGVSKSLDKDLWFVESNLPTH
jgi:starvation-inducible DNA-binding protein